MNEVCSWSNYICQNMGSIVTAAIGVIAAILGGFAGAYLIHRLGKRKPMQFESMEMAADGKPALPKNGKIKIRLFNPNKIAITVCDLYAIADGKKDRKYVVKRRRSGDRDWNKEPIVIKEWDIGEYEFVVLIDESRGVEVPNSLYGYYESHVELFCRDVEGSHSIGVFQSTYSKK